MRISLILIIIALCLLSFRVHQVDNTFKELVKIERTMLQLEYNVDVDKIIYKIE